MSLSQEVRKIQDGLERLETELTFAENLLSIYPDQVCRTEVEKARAFLAENRNRLSVQNVDGFVRDTENLMKKTSCLAKDLVVHCVGHAHIDMNWMWPFDETVAVVADTFSTVLTLMRRYPEFTFSQSQASVYKILEEYHPEILSEVRRRIKEGRWEVSSCTWVEADKNLASGESQVRQILYTKRYFKKLLGLDYDRLTLDFEPDTFGHSAFVPAILSRAGVKYYYHCRGFQGPNIYQWESPDGCRILVYFEKESWYIKHNLRVKPEYLTEYVTKSLRNTGLKDILFVYGIGDHGGGPTVRDIDNLIKAGSWPVFPTVQFSTYSAYFGKIARFADKFPVIKGERNFVMTGCYTSQSEIKKANRYGERHLGEAETFSALAARLTRNCPYPGAQLNAAWEKLLFNQFHDILPGSGIPATRRYTLAKYQEIIAATSSAKKQALSALSRIIDTAGLFSRVKPASSQASDVALGAGPGYSQDTRCLSAPGIDDQAGRAYVIFNPAPFQRSEIVEVTLWGMKNDCGFVVRDNSGEELSHQVLEEGNYWGQAYTRLLFEARRVPGLGYKTFVIYQDSGGPAETRPFWDARKEAPALVVLENELVRLELDSISGAVSKLSFKKDGLELVAPGNPCGLFRIIDETSFHYDLNMSAWITGNYSRIENLQGVKFVSSSVLAGPLRQGITWEARIRNSKIIASVYLEKGSPTVRFDCDCHWLEWGSADKYVPQLNMVFPVPLKNSVRTFEIPFGALPRDTENMDVPGLRWADISGEHADTGQKCGLTLYTDSKHGFRTGENFVSVSLLRSSFDPDPYPELGQHKFSLAFIPHAGMLDTCRAYQQATSLDQPLIAFQATSHKGKLPPEASLVRVLNPNLVLSCLKKPEDGPGLIVRLYEVAGKDTNAQLELSPALFPGKVAVTETDLLERSQGKTAHFRPDKITWKVPAHGVLTLLLE